MAYKLTNPDKWDDLWFSDLTPHAKLLFIFLYEKCDNAGFYEISEKFLPIYLGLTRDELIDAIEQIKKSYVKSEDNRTLWLKNYLKHQKMVPLNPRNNAHKQVILLLQDNLNNPKKFKSCKSMKKLIPVEKTERNTTQPQSNNTEKAIRFVKPTIEQVEQFMKEKDFKLAASESKRFWNWFESNGWKVGKNVPMKVWKGAANTWMFNWFERNKIEQKPRKIDNIKEAHEDLSGIDWNQVYSEPKITD